METLTAVSVAVIAAVMVLGLICLIPVLLQIRRTAKEAEKLFDTVRAQIAPISHDIIVISQDIKSIVKSVHRQVDRIEDGVEMVHDMAILAKDIQLELKRKIEKPMLQLAAILSGIKRGFEAVSHIFSR
jgi:uncharacterized protein YoxC